MEWISVEDRLPEDGQHVIGFCRTELNKEMHVEPLLYGETHKNWAYLFAYNEGYGYAEIVTHWMPLPLPPKNKKKKNAQHAENDRYDQMR